MEPSTVSLLSLAVSSISLGIAATRFTSESPLFKKT
jgi:hypothetical protein